MNNQIQTCKCGCFVFDAECKKCVKCGETYNECPENAAGLLADIDIFRVLKLPNEAINRINLFVSAHTVPLQSRITELEDALLKVRDRHIKNPITYNIITKALNNEA